MEKKSTEILVVEDNEVDSWLIRNALEACGIANTIHLVTEGNEALNFIMRIGPFKTVPVPDMILLDLNMPGLDGLDFLRLIKQFPELKNIPVIILSSSSHPNDIEETYRFRAAAYLNKPLNVNEIRPIVENLHLFRPNQEKREGSSS
jgi:CheY-like chemotaxis protein